MSTTSILLVLSGGCWILFVYPYLLYPQALRFLSKQPVPRAPIQLTTSLLFCAHNEIDCLPAKLENLRELKHRQPALQILVYDDASTDGTFEMLAAEPRLLTVLRGPGRTGKAAGMKRLVEQATGDVLIFTDANIILAADVVDRLLPYYASDEIGGVCCTIKSQVDAATITSQVGSAYVAIDDRLQQLESATGNVMGATGGLFSVRRKLYPSFADTVQDDFTVSMSVIFQHRRLVKATDVVGYEKAVSRSSEEFRRKVRIGARAYHTHAFLRPQIRKMSARDQFKYVSRKILRWYGGFFLALGGIFALLAVATLSATAAVALAVMLSIAVAWSFKETTGPLARAREIIVAIFATLAGVVQGMRGRTVAVWAPAKSR